MQPTYLIQMQLLQEEISPNKFCPTQHLGICATAVLYGLYLTVCFRKFTLRIQGQSTSKFVLQPNCTNNNKLDLYRLQIPYNTYFLKLETCPDFRAAPLLGIFFLFSGKVPSISQSAISLLLSLSHSLLFSKFSWNECLVSFPSFPFLNPK